MNELNPPDGGRMNELIMIGELHAKLQTTQEELNKLQEKYRWRSAVKDPPKEEVAGAFKHKSGIIIFGGTIQLVMGLCVEFTVASRLDITTRNFKNFEHFIIPIWEFTNWMPLPEPPKESEG